jgi:hypothetical protein
MQDDPLRSFILSSASFATNDPLRRWRVSGCWKEAIMKSFVIGALVVAVGVLGYLYWDSQQNTVVKLPGVEIKKN